MIFLKCCASLLKLNLLTSDAPYVLNFILLFLFGIGRKSLKSRLYNIIYIVLHIPIFN